MHCVPPITNVYKPHTLYVCSFQYPRFTNLIHSLLVSTQWPSAGSDIISSSVVTGEDDEKVVQDIELLEGGDDLAHAFVQCLHHPTVGPADICCVELLAHRVLFVLWGYLKRRCVKGDMH